MAATFALTTGVVYVRGWSGSVTGGTMQLGSGTTSAPAYSFTANSGAGMLYFPNNSVVIVSGTSASSGGAFAFNSNAGLVMGSNPSINWTTGFDPTGSSIDTSISRGGAAGKIVITGTTPMLQLGGTTSSFPAIKRNSAILALRLADDSADCDISAANAVLSGKATTYNNQSTTGIGLPYVLASSGATGLTAADTNRINYSPGATASTYELNGVVNVTAWTTPASFTVALTYKDASGNARTDTATVSRGSTGATAAAITAIDRWYFDFPAIDIDNSNTAITLSTTGTFTGSPVYNIAATLRRIK